MPKFRKKPVVIEARQFIGDTADLHSIYLWIEQNTLGSFEPMDRIEGRLPWPESGVTIDPRDGRMVIATLEGGHWVDLGDWIIQGVKGEFYPCKPDIFMATYDLDSRGTADEPITVNAHSSQWLLSYCDHAHDRAGACLKNRFGAKCTQPEARVKVTLFKPSGKYYTEEEWRIPEGAIGPHDMKQSPDFHHMGGAVLVQSQDPWGYPHILPADES